MITFKNILSEAFLPIELHGEKYFHGTQTTEAAKGILENGIQPNLVTKNGWMTPQRGMVYITKDLGYGLIYALGGDMVGTDYGTDYFEKKYGEYMYLFVIYGKQLKNIQPDEDSIGELFDKYDKRSVPDWLEQLAFKHVARSTIEKARDGEALYQTKLGNVLVKRMTDAQKLELILNGAHIANEGVLYPDEAWRFPRKRNNELKKNGSNFFKLAERFK